MGTLDLYPPEAEQHRHLAGRCASFERPHVDSAALVAERLADGYGTNDVPSWFLVRSDIVFGEVPGPEHADRTPHTLRRFGRPHREPSSRDGLPRWPRDEGEGDVERRLRAMPPVAPPLSQRSPVRASLLAARNPIVLEGIESVEYTEHQFAPRTGEVRVWRVAERPEPASRANGVPQIAPGHARRESYPAHPPVLVIPVSNRGTN